MNLDPFERDFLQEAAEHLAHVEKLLLGIDLPVPRAADIDAIFRTAHSIKGASAMFGFTDVAAVTHELESLLAGVRKGACSLTTASIDVLLEAADVLRALLAHRGGAGPLPILTTDVMCGRIRACAGGRAPPADIESAVENAARTLVIRCPAGALDDDGFAELLDQLRVFGAVDASLPTGDGARRVELVTAESDDVVRALFDFVMDARLLTIHAEPAAIVPAAAPSTTSSTAAASATSPMGSVGAGIPSRRAASNADAASEPAHAPPAAPESRALRESIRVGVGKVDRLVNEVGELVISQAILAQSIADLDAGEHAHLLARMADVQRSTRALQESVMSIRMLPIAAVFDRFPRLVRELAARLGKSVRVEIDGGQTELDKGLVEQVMDPLVHLVRNAIDHGIEVAEARLCAGKPACGTLRLSARHQGGSVVIEVGDDGRGLDRARIVAKARERGIPVPEHASDREVWNLVFEPGFSTAETVTDISGRGVGMDVVKRNVANLSGSIALTSTPGTGTCVSIRLPLTLAIMEGLAVSVGDECYIVPLAGIVESLQAAGAQLRSIAGQGRVVAVRDRFLPVVSLASVVGRPSLASPEAMFVVVEAEGTSIALAVDELLGQHQVVVKSLDTHYRHTPGFAGATIMGDGRVACILDLGAIVRQHQGDARPVLH
ncbi:MAG: chemotaxis protein CheA [Casimicrobiaceae bacterium]